MHNLNTRSLRITRSHVWKRVRERLFIPICMQLNMKQRFSDSPKATLVGTGSVLEYRLPDFADLVPHSFSTYPSLLWSAIALPPVFRTHRACCQRGSGQFSNPPADRLFAVRFLAWRCTFKPSLSFHGCVLWAVSEHWGQRENPSPLVHMEKQPRAHSPTECCLQLDLCIRKPS